jgi:hypothetical protein
MPNITEYLEKGIGDKPVVNCTMCLASKIIVPGLQEPVDASGEDDFEELYMLPCEHFFGLDCFANWAKQKFAERPNEGPKCPNCNRLAFPTPAEREAGKARFAPGLVDEAERRRQADLEMWQMEMDDAENNVLGPPGPFDPDAEPIVINIHMDIRRM